MDWDDLRFFLAVARAGTLSGAARSLAVNHATVLRRLRALESSLDATLFDRRPDGYGLTGAGEEILAHAERMEEEASAVDRRVTGRDVRLAGEVRVTTVDSIADGIIAPNVHAFAALYPGIALELSATDQWVSLSRREADIAVRPANDPGDSMVGRRLGRLGFGIYAADTYLADHPFNDWADARVILGDGDLAETAAVRWYRKQTEGSRAAVRATSYLTVREACRGGGGIACLPRFLAEGLTQVAEAPDTVDVDVWLLTHPELRKNARIRAVLDWLGPLVQQFLGPRSS